MNARNGLRKVIVFALLATTATVIYVGRTGATPQGESQRDLRADVVHRTGIYTLARGQTTALHVANFGSEPAEAEIAILDERGNVLAMQPCIVPPGQSETLSLSYDTLTHEGHQIRLRAEVRGLGGPHARASRGLFSSVEVLENASGASSLFVPTFVTVAGGPIGPNHDETLLESN